MGSVVSMIIISQFFAASPYSKLHCLLVNIQLPIIGVTMLYTLTNEVSLPRHHKYEGMIQTQAIIRWQPHHSSTTLTVSTGNPFATLSSASLSLPSRLTSGTLWSLQVLPGSKRGDKDVKQRRHM